MKTACITPDDLSTLIFCKTFSRILHEEFDGRVDTISAVDLYRKELEAIHSSHIEVPMARWLSPHRDLLYTWRLYRVLRRGGYDQVVTFTTKPNIYGVIAARLAGVPRVTLAVRGLGQVFNERKGLKHRLLHAGVKGLYRLSCRLADKVWFTNKNDLAYFAELGIVDPAKSFLTKNAVDLSQFSAEAVPPGTLERLRGELGLTADDRVVIMIARLIWSKGIREYVEAADRLRECLPNLRFLLVAPPEGGSAESVPEAFVREAEARGNFQWLGFRKDVRDLYALADLSVLPSYYKEGGYPRALLEAMALAKPVIAADTEDCKSPVEEGRNGYIVPPRDAGALAEAIGKVFEDDERRRAFGEYSLERMRREFDDQIVVREVLANLGWSARGGA